MLETGFVNIVQKIAEERGKDIFLEVKRLKSLLLDYAKNEYKSESNLLLAMLLDTDCIKFINRAENLAECKQFIIKSLEEEKSLSPQKSAEMLDLLFLVLHGVKLEPEVFDVTVSKFSQSPTEKTNIKPKLQLIHNFILDSCFFRMSVAFSPNSKFIISVYQRGLKLWSVETGHCRRHLYYHGILDGAISHDGEYAIFKVSDGDLRLLVIKSGELIRSFDEESINFVSFSPNGKYIIFGCCDGTIKLWDIWKDERDSLPHIFRGHEGEVNYVSFSPDGHNFVSMSNDNIIKLWNVKDGYLIRTFIGHKKEECFFRQIGSVSFNPNGLVFASGASDGIKLWNVESEYPIFSTTINDVKYVKNITSIAFSPMGDYIISGASDGSLILWKIENNRFIIKTMEMHESITSVAFSPDGKYIASASFNGTVKLWGIK